MGLKNSYLDMIQQDALPLTGADFVLFLNFAQNRAKSAPVKGDASGCNVFL